METGAPGGEQFVTEEAEVSADAREADDAGDMSEEAEARGKPVDRLSWKRLTAYAALPGVALILAGGAGYLKWQSDSVRQSETARVQSVRAASESTVALLSYRPDSIEKDLTAARDRLNGSFQIEYTKLINDVVIPGAKKKHISAVANVPAAASVSATENQAVVLVFVDQTVSVGDDPPASTASSVRVTLEKVDDRWLISQFDPV